MNLPLGRSIVVKGDSMYRLLVVEDEDIIRRGIISLVNFKELKIGEVFEAVDGEEALKKFKENKPHLILSDVNIPKLNGLEFMEACKKENPQVKIAIITGYNYFDYALTALKIGIDDFLLKPVSKSDISAVLSKLVQKLEEEKSKEAVSNIIDNIIDRPTQTDSAYKEKIQKIIEDNLGNENLSLTKISEEMAFSLGYASALFKKIFGVTFQDYIVNKRMEKAKILLLSTELKNYEIAQAVGIEDANYFSAAFKKKHGMSPNQYKNKIRGDSK